MFDRLTLFQQAGAMARHASARETVVARNIANADTPGFRAQRIGDFAEYVRDTGPGKLLRTRPEHLGSVAGATPPRPRDAGGEAAPNGNTVSLEQEMIASAEVGQEHRRALAIYRHGLGLIRTALGRG